MDCQAITLGEHLLWNAMFNSFGHKKWATLKSPIFIGWVKAVSATAARAKCLLQRSVIAKRLAQGKRFQPLSHAATVV